MERLSALLKERAERGLLRRLYPASMRSAGNIYIGDKQYTDLSSNDYLGLSGHPAIREASREALERYGTGSTASRLLSGDLAIHHELEARTAAFKEKPAALIFNTGYQANISIISAMCKKGDAVFCDRLSHASIIDGVHLSGARLFRFKHNDTGHLQALLKGQRHGFDNSLIITEAVFSMDGDIAPLREIVGLKKRYGSMLMVDEAHATGVFGERASGIVSRERLAKNVDLIMGTFSKALGSFGAYLACDKDIRDYLINVSRGFIYSTSLPAHVIAANLKAIELAENELFRRKELLENSLFLRESLRENGFDVRGESQIIPLILGDNKKAAAVGEALRSMGYWAFPIRPPTVPEGESRLRFSITYGHKKDALKRLADDTCKACGI